MKKLSGSQLCMVCSVVLAGGWAASACSSESPPPATGSSTSTGGQAAATGGGTATGGASAATGTGTATGGVAPASGTGGAATGGASTATGGAPAAGGGAAGATTSTAGAGGEVVTKDCAAPVTVATNAITNFDDYDGATALADWSFSFNGDDQAVGAVYAGPYAYDDASGTQQFVMVAGYSGNYAVSISNAAATEWGGGMGFWFTCMDASAFSGISFYVRGSNPTGEIYVSLAMGDTTMPDADNPDGGGTCVGTTDEECVGPEATFPLTTDWTLVQLAWTDFTDGLNGTTPVPASGANITGMNFNVNLNWEEDPNNAGTWIPVQGSYSLEIDDLAFF